MISPPPSARPLPIAGFALTDAASRFIEPPFRFLGAPTVTRFSLLLCLGGALALCAGCDDSGDGVDAGPPAPGTDAGPPAPGTDAGPATGTDAGPGGDPEIQAICDRLPGFEEACDIEQEHVTIRATATPAYEDLFPGVTQFNMNGWEWWQKWPGGFAPTFEYSEATPEGIVCSVASALRFAAVMHSPPEDIVRLLSETTWEGRFFNWNDDYSMESSSGDASGSELWAWRDYLIKWISQTSRDGTCYLPTYSMLESAAANCLATAAGAAGNIQGCTN